MKMQLGPQKTQTGAFKGFGFGGGPKAAGPPGSRPAAGGFSIGKAGASAPKAKAKAKAGAGGGISAMFKESLDDEEEDGTRRDKKTGLPSWAKPSEKAREAEKMAQELAEEDPSVFQYDEVIDEIREDSGLEALSQAVRADAVTQKKRVGLTVPKGAEIVATGSQRQAKYIEKVMIATDRRKVEQQIIEDRLLKKEKDARKDCEVFVTEAFKEELKKRKKFEDDMERQDTMDQIKSAEKQENGKGFADMYRNLLNGGLASGRGGEKLKDQVVAKDDENDVDDNEVFGLESLKKEVKEDIKEEDDGGEGHGVKDVASEPPAKKVKAEPQGPPPKTAEEIAAEAAAEKVVREEKAMSAKERFLARKKAAAAAGEE